MAKPIKCTDAILEKIVEEFRESVKSSKMFDGKISYNKSFKWEKDEKAVVVFSPLAFSKMLKLLYEFTTEVAWHGTVYRDAEHPNVFRIEDIFVYPQLVSGGNVETDQVAYQSWLYALDDEVFNNLRMQGHSHVDFSTIPSPVDVEHQGKILEQLDDDMFYIFVIWNKRMEYFIKIFDMANNTLYDKDEVIITIGDADDMQTFIDSAKAIVKPRQTTGFNGNATNSYTAQKSGTTTHTGGAPASRPKSGGSTPPVGKSGNGYDPGYDDKSGYPGGYGYYYNGWR